MRGEEEGQGEGRRYKRRSGRDKERVGGDRERRGVTGRRQWDWKERRKER